MVEVDRLCPICKKKFIRFFYEAYCTQSGRGANSQCKAHLDKLICSDCAVKIDEEKERGKQRCPICGEEGSCTDSNGETDIFECKNHHNWGKDSKDVEMSSMLRN